MTEKKKMPPLSNVWGEAKVIIWAHRKRLALGFALIVLNRLAGFVLPGSSKYLIDEVIGKSHTGLLPLLALGAGAATVFQAGTSFALSQVLGVAAQRVITELRKNMQQHVVRLPISFFDATKTGVLISRVMTDPEGVRNLVGTGLVQLVGGFLSAGLGLIILFYLNWRLTSVTLVVLLIFGGCMAYAFSYLRPIFRQRGEINAIATGRLTETFSGIRVVKGYTAERREDLVFAKGVHRLFRNIAKTITGVSAMTAVTTAIVGMIGVVMIWMGGNAVLNNDMSLGDLVVYTFVTALVAAPLVQIASIGTQITEAFAGLDRMREIRSLATEVQEDLNRLPLEQLRGDVTFEDVWFEYKPDIPVLRGINFEAPAGTTTALVGSSGSGKSTLIGLVMAFHWPQRGTVRVDGRDLATLRLHDYRDHLGIVLQDNFLFDGTVADNIRFAKPHATLEEVMSVSRIAHCDEFIEKFEHGYDTIVGERGVRLSGGQRQRVAIARAILADPTILILDEATSSLDSESEAMIQDGLRTLREGRTTFVIAHRLSTIRSADQILVLEGGEIVERGSHETLLALGGRYRELYDKQYRLEANRFINPGEEFVPLDVNDDTASK